MKTKFMARAVFYACEEIGRDWRMKQSMAKFGGHRA